MSKFLILAAFVAVAAIAPFATVLPAQALEDCGFSTKCGPGKTTPPIVDCGFSTTCGPNKKKPVALGRVKPVVALGRVKPVMALGRVKTTSSSVIPETSSKSTQPKEKHHEIKEHQRNQQHVSLASSGRRHR